MAKVKLTKEEADRIMKIKGNVIGAVFKGYEDYIKEYFGKEGITKVEKKLEEIGYPLSFKKISSFRWYPEAHACITCLAMLDVFDLDESKAFDIGYYAPSKSILARLLIRYFRTIETTVENFPKYFKKHVDFAEMKCNDFDPKKRVAYWRIINFKKFHPIVYEYIRGYLTRITEMTTNTKNVKVEQTKSLYNNDPYDEFKITW
jgi:hypothetical protein